MDKKKTNDRRGCPNCARKDREISELKYNIQLQHNILRHVFREYQELRDFKAADIYK